MYATTNIIQSKPNHAFCHTTLMTSHSNHNRYATTNIHRHSWAFTGDRIYYGGDFWDKAKYVGHP